MHLMTVVLLLNNSFNNLLNIAFAPAKLKNPKATAKKALLINFDRNKAKKIL